MKHADYYYEHADLVVSTNGLFSQPENDVFQQRTWFNARETMAKEKLKNQSEINSLCDQIIAYLGPDFTKTPAAQTDTLTR